MLYKNILNFKQPIEDLNRNILTRNSKLLILTSGPLGAGKTEFTIQLGQYLNLKEISSPTFALHQCYESTTYELHHWDLYRLNDQEDLESSGFWDQFDYKPERLEADKKKIIVVEWPERIPPTDWPLHWPTIKIVISYNSENSRDVEILKDHNL